MLNLHCHKKAHTKKKKKKNYAITEIRTKKYGFKIHRGVHYAIEAGGINR